MLQNSLWTTQNAGSNYSQVFLKSLHLHSMAISTVGSGLHPISDTHANRTGAKRESSLLGYAKVRNSLSEHTVFAKIGNIWNFLVVSTIIWVSTTMGQFMKAFSVQWIPKLPPACVISPPFREAGRPSNNFTEDIWALLSTFYLKLQKNSKSPSIQLAS